MLFGLGLTARRTALAGALAALFTNGEQGFLFVNDLSTMYQDSAGTTPAALEQPLGLWLDSRYGAARSAELTVNGEFDTATDWTGNNNGVPSIAGGVLTVTNNGAFFGRAQNSGAAIPVAVGDWFQWTVSVPADSANPCSVKLAIFNGAPLTNVSATINPGVTLSGFIQATAAGTGIARLENLSGVDGATFKVASVSIRKVAGNHATQPTSANRPTVSARYNKCTNNNANPVDLTGMTKSGDAAAVLSVVDDSAALAAAVAAGVIPAGKATSGKVYLLDNTAGVAQAYANAAGTTGNLNSHTVSAYVRGTGTARVGTNSVATIPQTPLTGAYQRVVFTAASGTTGQTLYVTAEPGAVVYFILNDMRESVHAIPGIPTPQVVTGSGANYDSAGFPVRVKFNGTNQWMQTASVDLSGTDKATVFGGVTKLSDAAIGFPMEWGNVATGDTPNWTLNAPRGAGANTYGLDVRAAGIVSTVTPSGYSAPHSSILAGAIDRAGATISDQVKLRVNGALPAQGPNGSGPIAAGNFASFPAFIGCRGQGNSNFFNGDIYAMAARGAATSDAAIAWAEQDINARMGRVY
jgi:hypothetical protein